MRARVSIPRLAVSAPIEFLVDTGADRTAIHWNDRLAFEGAGAVPCRRTPRSRRP